MLKPKLKPSWRFFLPILLALFFLSLLSTKSRRAPWYEQLAWNAISPVTSVLSWIDAGLGGVWEDYIYLVGVSKENDRLKQRLETLRQKQVRFEELSQENNRLHALLQLKQSVWPDSVAAQVIAFDPRDEFRSIRINKGRDAGIRPDMPVMALDGLVGKVGPVFKKEALVLLIVDPASHVDVFVQRSRVRGLLVGSGLRKKIELRPGFFMTRLEYVKNESDILKKDVLITSGFDRLFPKGILVGEVETTEESRYGIFLKADVIPSVDFSRLEEVLVLKES